MARGTARDLSGLAGELAALKADARHWLTDPGYAVLHLRLEREGERERPRGGRGRARGGQAQGKDGRGAARRVASRILHKHPTPIIPITQSALEPVWEQSDRD